MNKFLFLVVGILVLSNVYALEIDASYDTNIMVPEMGTEIELTLSVSNVSSGDYNVYTLSDIYLTPSDTFFVGDSSFEKSFVLSPTENLDVEGLYSFTYTLNHRGIKKYDEELVLNLMNLEDVIEVSSENVNSSSNEVEFYVRNLENVYLKDLKANFKSIVFETTESFDLAPFEKKVFRVVGDGYKLKKTKAGVYVIDAVFETLRGSKRIDGTLYLGEKKGVSTTEDRSGFLIVTDTISKINTGNVFETVEISLNRNILSRLFTTFNIDPTIIERSGFVIKYTWVKERLGPAEIITVKAKTNYLLPILIIVFAVLALLGVKRFSESRLIVKKSVRPVKTKGGEFALKITLSMKAIKPLENLTIIDRIPHIVKIYRKFGNVHPDKIDPHSRRIHWNIGDLSAGEERIISYVVYSKVGVVGKFSLPRALAVFEKDDNVHEVESNNVFFMNEQISGND